ncbi:MAG: PglZ domain-containing protein, partial [Firmicutes bacterium]|nr:PglZ domain-containing protein [Bacillota bacterium]
KRGDSFIFFNFRPDRAKQITLCATQKDFCFDKKSGRFFDRKNGFLSPNFVCFTNYDSAIKNVKIVLGQKEIFNTFGQVLSDSGLSQVRIAETEKFFHVTSFFNGGVDTVFKNEERILIDSVKVCTYDRLPQMSAAEVSDAAIAKVGLTDFLIVNFANCDMVGHTGNFEAAKRAVEAVDGAVKKVVDAVLKGGGFVLLTSDHGNAEQMFADDCDCGCGCESGGMKKGVGDNKKSSGCDCDNSGNNNDCKCDCKYVDKKNNVEDEKKSTGSKSTALHTAHTSNPVPLCLISENHKNITLNTGGILADIAPTLLDLLNIKKPPQMTGKSLLNK